MISMLIFFFVLGALFEPKIIHAKDFHKLTFSAFFVLFGWLFIAIVRYGTRIFSSALPLFLDFLNLIVSNKKPALNDIETFCSYSYLCITGKHGSPHCGIGFNAIDRGYYGYGILLAIAFTLKCTAQQRLWRLLCDFWQK